MKEDKKNLIIFIVLIILILSVLAFNMYKNKKLENINRKIEYIFNNLTYDNVYSKGSELFLQTIDLLNKKNIFEYEKDNNGSIKYYAINDYNHYKKIQNFMIVTNTLAKEEVKKFMEDKKIINYENHYYIETYQEEINNNYIGSIIEINSYDEKYVYFESINYYCDNHKYIGLIEKEPNCNYNETQSNFTLVLENNALRINKLEEIKNIIK